MLLVDELNSVTCGSVEFKAVLFGYILLRQSIG